MRRRRLLLGMLALVAVTAGGCQKKDQGVLWREGEPDYVETFDKQRMDAAISEARATLETFVAALDAQAEGTDRFAIKKGFSYGKDGSTASQ